MAAISHLRGEASDTPDTSQYLTFMLGSDVFAMDIRTVREIIQYGTMTTVPLMPTFVRGVINLRGAVVPVIDLQARFGHPPASVGRRTCIVVFDAVRHGERLECGQRGGGHPGQPDRAGAQLWHRGAARLHPRHGQGRRGALHRGAGA